MSGHRIVAAGDSAVSVEFDARIDVAINARAIALADALQAAAVAGVRDVVPAYRTVTVFFDPLRIDYEALVARLDREADRAISSSSSDREPVRVPVCYGGEFGPDLDEVAAFGGISPDEVVRLHTESPFRVFMLGFVPGFAYLGLVDERIAAPRRTAPRVRVARGSVGLAGRQTGIIPMETPSGWCLIGRTPVQPFDLRRDDPFLVKAGDRVQFCSIDRQEFDRLRSGL